MIMVMNYISTQEYKVMKKQLFCRIKSTIKKKGWWLMASSHYTHIISKLKLY